MGSDQLIFNLGGGGDYRSPLLNDLVRLAIALGALECGGPLSPAEEAVASRPP